MPLGRFQPDAAKRVTLTVDIIQSCEYRAITDLPSPEHQGDAATQPKPSHLVGRGDEGLRKLAVLDKFRVLNHSGFLGTCRGNLPVQGESFDVNPPFL